MKIRLTLNLTFFANQQDEHNHRTMIAKDFVLENVLTSIAVKQQ